MGKSNISKKPIMLVRNKGKSITIKQAQRGRGLRLELFQDRDFLGRRILFSRGEIAVRTAAAFQFNDVLTSFRVENSLSNRQVTFVIFEHRDYQGRFHIFRGSQEVQTLLDSPYNFNDLMSSFILVARRLTNNQVLMIQQNRRAPSGILEIND